MYVCNEIFYSLQGEGARKGVPNVFVRFSGCNLQCSVDNYAGFDCDTEFTSGVKYMSEGDLVAAIIKCGGNDIMRRAVILTGGEPALQVDHFLVNALHQAGFFIAIETNGTHELPEGIDWISCSPKTAEHTLRCAEEVDELRYVRNEGQGLPKPSLKAHHYYLSPAFRADGTIDPGAMETCQQLCLENPKWALSVQDHKQWRMR
jgi:organic radical activating enzyme